MLIQSLFFRVVTGDQYLQVSDLRRRQTSSYTDMPPRLPAPNNNKPIPNYNKSQDGSCHCNVTGKCILVNKQILTSLDMYLQAVMSEALIKLVFKPASPTKE